jgi:protein-disulfide isomerase
MRRYLPFAIIGVIFLLAIGSGVMLYRWKQAGLGPVIIAPDKPGAEPPHIRGGETARVTLEEFGDFQCPPCGALFGTLTKLEHDYGPRLRVIFRHYPMRRHKHALVAAYAAEAAGLQNHFWEMHDLLFQNSANWGKGADANTPTTGITLTLDNPSHAIPDEKTDTDVRAIFAGFAATLKLDEERFKNDIDSEQVKMRITLDQQRAAALSVDRTPTLFINGRLIPAASRTEDRLRALIDAELSGKTPAPEPSATTPPPPS